MLGHTDSYDTCLNGYVARKDSSRIRSSQYRKLLDLYALYFSRTTLCFQRYEVTELSLRVVTLLMLSNFYYNIVFNIRCLISSGKDFGVKMLPCASESRYS